ncbi:MAG: hypothetical protein V3T70_02780 [Phycisphaerae bacterium]
MRPLRLDEYWERRRRRMIAETELFLSRALEYRLRAPIIPSFPVGRGRFPPALAAVFWRRILFEMDLPL